MLYIIYNNIKCLHCSVRTHTKPILTESIFYCIHSTRTYTNMKHYRLKYMRTTDRI